MFLGICVGPVKMLREKNDDENNLVIRLFGVLSHFRLKYFD